MSAIADVGWIPEWIRERWGMCFPDEWREYQWLVCYFQEIEPLEAMGFAVRSKAGAPRAYALVWAPLIALSIVRQLAMGKAPPPPKRIAEIGLMGLELVAPEIRAVMRLGGMPVPPPPLPP